MSRPEVVSGPFGHDWAAARLAIPVSVNRDFIVSVMMDQSGTGSVCKWVLRMDERPLEVVVS